jgi:hypothetical protein
MSRAYVKVLAWFHLKFFMWEFSPKRWNKGTPPLLIFDPQNIVKRDDLVALRRLKLQPFTPQFSPMIGRRQSRSWNVKFSEKRGVDTDEETNLRYCWRLTDETGSVQRSIAVGCSQLKLSRLQAERRVHLNRESLLFTVLDNRLQSSTRVSPLAFTMLG